MKALEMKYFCKFLGRICNFNVTYKDYLLNFYYLNAFENRNFCKLKLKKPDVFLNFV